METFIWACHDEMLFGKNYRHAFIVHKLAEFEAKHELKAAQDVELVDKG